MVRPAVGRSGVRISPSVRDQGQRRVTPGEVAGKLYERKADGSYLGATKVPD